MPMPMVPIRWDQPHPELSWTDELTCRIADTLGKPRPGATMTPAQLIEALRQRRDAIQDGWLKAKLIPSSEAYMVWLEAYRVACRRYYRAMYSFT